MVLYLYITKVVCVHFLVDSVCRDNNTFYADGSQKQENAMRDNNTAISSYTKRHKEWEQVNDDPQLAAL